MFTCDPPHLIDFRLQTEKQTAREFSESVADAAASRLEPVSHRSQNSSSILCLSLEIAFDVRHPAIHFLKVARVKISEARVVEIRIDANSAARRAQHKT